MEFAVVSALGRWRQEDQEVKARLSWLHSELKGSLGYLRSSLGKKANNCKYPYCLLKTLLWSSPAMDLKSTNTSGTPEVTWGSDPSSSSQPLLQTGPCSSAYGFLPVPGMCQAIPT